MAKIIELADVSLDRKITVIGSLFFGDLSNTELRVLVQLVHNGENGQLNLTADASKTICKALNLNQNSFSVVIHRLTNKKAITKRNSVITFHPILPMLNQENEFIIRFKHSTLKTT